jgi:ABC-type multidrug transport system fused ATPase/permease subunit
MVLEKGEIVEFDSPKLLVLKEDGAFLHLLKETGDDNYLAMKRQILGDD